MLNICGCLVTTMTGTTDAVIAAIDATEGGEVHAHEDDRLVVTIEDTDTMPASEQIMNLNHIPGVLSVTLTYHHFEEPGAPDAAASLAQL